MFNPLKGLGDIKQMRDQALKIQKELSAEQIAVEKNGVKVVISGDQKIIELETHDCRDEDIREAVNEAIRKSQEAGAKKLSSMTGGLSNLLGK